MRRTALTLVAAGFVVLLAASRVSTQAPFAATYDGERQIKLEGPVTRIEWVTPKAFVFLDVRDATGTTNNWAVEIGNPLELEKDGWKRSTLHIGDVLTVEGTPARGARTQVFAKTVSLKGKRLFAPSARRAAAASGPAPRWPDKQIRLGPPDGRRGYWGPSSAKALVETSAANVAMNDDGLLANLSDVDRVAPFKPWARALYVHRQRNLLAADPYARCIPPGGPRQFQMAHGFQFVEQRDLGRILVLHGGGDRNWRVIFTDGRQQSPPAELVPTYYGNSVGRWEKDTLVVDSVGYNEKFWMTNGGIPHTEALHLIERFTRTDLNTLRYDVTVDDPRTFTRTWNGGWTMRWVPDEDIQEYFCEDRAVATSIR